MISDPSSDHASIPRVSHDGQGSDVIPTLTYKINQLKKQIEEDRILTVKEKHERNKKKVETQLSELLSISTSRKDVSVREDNSSGIMLSRKMESPLFQINSLFQGSGERDYANGEEIVLPTTTKLPLTERIPPYTTWIFLDKNQRMVEDQSVVGRRRIYYEQRGSEALICSDSEEEITEEEEKHLFTNVEDRILRMVVRDFELSDAVLQILTQYVGGTILEIQERCNFLKEKNEEMQDLNLKSSEESDLVGGISLDKSLTSALDSYDTIFCRRCLVFDCRLHGCSQTLIYPQSEKKPYSFDSGDDGKPCGDKCYLQSQGTGGLEESFGMGSKHRSESKRVKSSVSDAKGSDEVAKTSETEVNPKSAASDKMEEIRDDKGEDVTEVEEERLSRRWDWKPFERELYLKGIEIFGRNSCLIARNLLPGLKTCMEVSRYMNAGGAAMTQSYFEEYGGTHAGHMDSDMAPRSRMLRKRGRTRKLKYSTKSAGHPLIWRRIVTGKNQTCHQYTPCECQSMCGKQCPCLLNGTCCEKYCGCIKNCKNRFRGCHCGKSQCKSRQCPCFAAGRECDPDVCKNCWVSCGDETMGEPPKQGEGQCGNMRLLLRQQQRILLAKSDVAGWGAFLKNSVNKNDYLGEYTGELISHREADKRGKIYDRANSSFLFDLNDEYVLDAYRKGDKLKFANHSANPNCYAKIMLVAGDHRVGIFAKERIEANEEIFYDYRYGPNEAPVWARKPEDSKRDASQGPQARARKHQSH